MISAHCSISSKVSAFAKQPTSGPERIGHPLYGTLGIVDVFEEPTEMHEVEPTALQVIGNDVVDADRDIGRVEPSQAARVKINREYVSRWTDTFTQRARYRPRTSSDFEAPPTRTDAQPI